MLHVQFQVVDVKARDDHVLVTVRNASAAMFELLSCIHCGPRAIELDRDRAGTSDLVWRLDHRAFETLWHITQATQQHRPRDLADLAGFRYATNI